MKEDPCPIGVLTWLTCSDDADLPELSRPCDSRLFDRWAVRARLMSAPGLMVAGIWTRPMVMGFLLGSAIIARPAAAVVAPCAVIVMPPAIRDRLHGIDSNLINADGMWLRHGCQSRARWKGKQASQSKCECDWPRHFSDDPKLMKMPAHYSVTSGNGTVRSV